MASMRARLRRVLPFALISLQVQIPTVALGPVLLVIASDTGLSAAQLGALTSIPVFCFALLTPVAPLLLARLGLDRAIVLACLGVGAGVLARSLGTIPALYAGSVLLGASIAIVNIAIPTFVTRHFRNRALLLTGINTAATNTGSASAALFSAPLVALLGWQVGLGIWAVVSFVAAACWWFLARSGPATAGPTSAGRTTAGRTTAGRTTAGRTTAGAHSPSTAMPAGGHSPSIAIPTGHSPSTALPTGHSPSTEVRAAGTSSPSALRLPIAWVLGFTFAMHGICYFGVATWLPTLLSERSGLSAELAGACVAVFMALGIAGPLLLPVLMRWASVKLWMLMTATTIGWLACACLLAFAPAWWVLAVLVGGMVQGACFTVIVTFGVTVARDEAQSRGIQAVLQTIGFGFAAVGPILLGLLLDATGSWQPPLLVMVAAGVALVALGAVASRMLVRHDSAARRPEGMARVAGVSAHLP